MQDVAREHTLAAVSWCCHECYTRRTIEKRESRVMLTALLCIPECWKVITVWGFDDHFHGFSVSQMYLIGDGEHGIAGPQKQRLFLPLHSKHPAHFRAAKTEIQLCQVKASSKGSSKASQAWDIISVEGCVYLGFEMELSHEVKSEVIFLAHFTAILEG